MIHKQPKESDGEDLRAILASARDGVLELAESLVTLARIEVQRDAKKLSTLAVQGLVCLGLFIVAYGLFVAVVVLGLSKWIPTSVALVSVGAVHAISAVWLGIRLSEQRRHFRPMALTSAEVVKVLSSLKGSFPHSSPTTSPLAAIDEEQRS